MLLILLFVLAAVEAGANSAAVGYKNKTWGYEIRNMEMQLEGKPFDKNGTFFRQSIGRQKKSWFLGMGLLNAFRFEDGKGLYSANFVETPSYCADRPKDMSYIPCDSDPSTNHVQADTVTVQPMPDGSVMTATDDICWNKVQVSNLEQQYYPLRRDDVYCDYPHRIAGPAHVHIDPKTSAVIGFVELVKVNSTASGGYQIFEVTKTAPSSRILRASIPAHPVNAHTIIYMHSFALTENYVIITEQPFRNGFFTQAPGCQSNLTACFKFYKNRPGVWRVVDRRTWQEVGTHLSSPFCFYHHVNAYEQGDMIVVDFIGYPADQCIDTIKGTMVHNLKHNNTISLRSRLERWIIPQTGATNLSQPLIYNLHKHEMPVINYWHYNTQPYDYIYAVGTHKGAPIWDTVTKFQLSTNSSIAWREPGSFMMEPMFVQKPEATSEDDGWLLSQGLQSGTNTTFVVVLDAINLQETGRYWLPTGVSVPFGFHGRFI